MHIILTGVITLFTFFLPETYPATLLAKKSAALRIESPNVNFRSKHELNQKSTTAVLRDALIIPIQLLFTELPVILVALYSGVIYGILYLYFAAFPLIFKGRYGFTDSQSGATFAGVGLGVFISAGTAGIMNKLYLKLEAKHGNGKRFPEGRLPFSMVAAVLAPISIFWLGWSGRGPEVCHWIVPVLSGVV